MMLDSSIALKTLAMPKLPALLPRLMRAVVLPSPSLSPQAFQHRDIPVVLPKGREVLVKVAACAVAFRDILDRKGAFPFIKQPTVLGHEIAGVVAAVGPDAREFQIGQRVVSLHWAQRDAWPSPLQVIAYFSFPAVLAAELWLPCVFAFTVNRAMQPCLRC